MSNTPKKQTTPRAKRSTEDSWREIRSGRGGLLGKKLSKAYMTSMPKGK